MNKGGRSRPADAREKAIWITEHDKRRLINLIKEIKEPEAVGGLQQLRIRLDDARVVEPKGIPEDVVTMNCIVRLREPVTLEETEYWLRFSAGSKPGSRVVPILSDLGIALLGSREGDTLEWADQSGRRTSKIVQIVYQPERLGNYEL